MRAGGLVPSGTSSVSSTTAIQPLVPPPSSRVCTISPDSPIEGDEGAVEERGEDEVVDDRRGAQRLARHRRGPQHLAGGGVDGDDLAVADAHVGAEVGGLVGDELDRRVDDRRGRRRRRPTPAA